ncbi:MAG TPA: DUF1501 domain-containing protein [Pyrinomonadaceae bacterium]|jgi:uncharacterized protein (DUF1501 family)|nr:DUF1501 domain-containing protein [Pyrinomonadaceae bacterium]
MAHTRRDFLRTAACALGGAALASTVESFGLMDAYAQSAGDYKALVCVFLNGGNDGNNMVVPLDQTGFGQYNGVRGASGLAVAQASLLPVAPPSQGRPFGFHPNMPEVQSLFNQGRLAVVCNAGPLVEPLTRATYLNGSGRKPLQLFSHSDQVNLWQTSLANSVSQTGWGGRIADRMAALNNPSTFSHSISIAGVSTFLTGSSARQLAIADANTALANLLPVAMTGTPGEIPSRRAAFDQLRATDLSNRLVKAASDIRSSALQTSQQLSQVTPRNFSTAFPLTGIARQLLQVGRVIAERGRFGMKRQIFFVQAGGYDTHSNQRGAGTGTQDSLLLQLSQALGAFYNLLQNDLSNPANGNYLGSDVTKEVTVFTLSDFGRTLQPAGSGAVVGSDHGWGNHHLVLGGAVRGGDFYGTFPTLALGGPDDTDTRGRWIPTTSVEQYAATLASWYGLSASDFPAVFPLINRFPNTNLGFMT